MKKTLIALLLGIICNTSFAFTTITVRPLDLPQVLKAAQQIPAIGTVKSYKRMHGGHEGKKYSEYLYLSVSPQYMKTIYPMVKQTLQSDYPNIQPLKNKLGPHITLFDNAPPKALAYVGRRFPYQIDAIKLIIETKLSGTHFQYHKYFVSFSLKAPKLINTFKKIKPAFALSHPHLSIAEWRDHYKRHF
jgi:hypothetical protein